MDNTPTSIQATSVVRSPHVRFFLLLIITLALCLFFSHAYAGTDGAELQPAVAKVQGLIGGWGGKLLCLISLGLALIGSVLKFNPYVIVGCLGVCITTALGVGLVNAMVTALI
jgi:hypothetical protein